MAVTGQSATSSDRGMPVVSESFLAKLLTMARVGAPTAAKRLLRDSRR